MITKQRLTKIERGLESLRPKKYRSFMVLKEKIGGDKKIYRLQEGKEWKEYEDLETVKSEYGINDQDLFTVIDFI